MKSVTNNFADTTVEFREANRRLATAPALSIFDWQSGRP
jgi:hypothetical protein